MDNALTSRTNDCNRFRKWKNTHFFTVNFNEKTIVHSYNNHQSQIHKKRDLINETIEITFKKRNIIKRFK
jgi:hypothetical protein